MKVSRSVVVAIALCLPWYLVAAPPLRSDLSVEVAGVDIRLPAPAGFTQKCSTDPDLARVITGSEGDNLETLACFLTEADCDRFMRGAVNSGVFSPYLLVKTYVPYKDRSVTTEQFSDVRKIVRKEQARLVNELRPELRTLLKEGNQALSRMAGEKVELLIDEVTTLGVFSESNDHITHVMLLRNRLATRRDEETYLQVATTSIILIRGKVLFAYAYQLYRGPEDLRTVTSLAAQWVDHLAAANEEE